MSDDRFDNFHHIDSVAIEKEFLIRDISRIILDKVYQNYRFFVVKKSGYTKGSIPFVDFVLYGSNNICNLIDLIGEVDVSFFRTGVVNSKYSIVSMTNEDVAMERISSSQPKEKDELFAMLLVDYLLRIKK